MEMMGNRPAGACAEPDMCCLFWRAGSFSMEPEPEPEETCPLWRLCCGRLCGNGVTYVWLTRIGWLRGMYVGSFSARIWLKTGGWPGLPGLGRCWPGSYVCFFLYLLLLCCIFFIIAMDSSENPGEGRVGGHCC
ncbi:hypothetical protein F5X96DRAFT_647035 [Biscogniauxia mediterranea]|nr:hypothetical protein F5X96DRAFT_647035 [Biscogniauxia mediterranea]